ncbi:MAG: hypothetical protein KDH94_00460 [Coxiellaceae bacterium]|nr:hypothetical protein [Coxiellaceae bacterium]
MKKLIIAFLLLLFAVWIGFLIHQDPGYILITYNKWSLETSLWVAIIAIILTFAALYFLLRLFRHTTRLGKYLNLWNKERRERKSGELMNLGFNALVGMEWKQAEDLFSGAAKNSFCPIINYSIAAYSAQQTQALKRRDEYLTKLPKYCSDNKTAELVQSYFYIASQQWNEALNILLSLQKKYPEDPTIIRFLAKTWLGIGDANALKDTLPQLKKYCDRDEYQRLEIDIYKTLINKAIHHEWLDQVWSETPKTKRLYHEIAATYAIKAAELHRDNEAVTVIETALKKEWANDLIQAYGKLKSDNVNKQINHAESWAKNHPNDADLFVCLGRLCIHAKLWGKARDYLNKALDLNATAETYIELARLFEATNDQTSALESYRKAAATN